MKLFSFLTYLFMRSSAISKTAAWSSSIRLPVNTRPVAVVGRLYVNGTLMSNVVPERERERESYSSKRYVHKTGHKTSCYARINCIVLST